MKKKIFIAALAALVMGMLLPGQVINVTSPTASDDWCIGTTYSITWTKSGDVPDTVTVRLRRARSSEGAEAALVISSSTENDGLLRWPIPESVEPGEYFIRVRTLRPDGEVISGDSPNFTIEACTRPTPAASSVRVSEPGADDEWCPGSRHTIRWLTLGKTSHDVDIRLRRAGSPASEAAVETIVVDTPDIGRYSWTIPNSVPPGEYFIRVKTGSPGGNVNGDSPDFKIVRCPCDLEMKSISYTYGHGGQIVARVANHLNAIDQDVRFYLVFPEMTRDGAHSVTRRLTLAAESEGNVYLWGLPQNDIPLRGLQVRATIDGPTSRITETNEDNNAGETRIAILDLSCRAPRDDLTLHRIYMKITEYFRVEFKIRVRHNLAREIRNIPCHWDLIGADGGVLRTYDHAIESLAPGEEHIWRVNETYGKEGRDGSKRPRLREGATYRIRAYISDPGDVLYDVNPSNDSYTISFRFPD